MFVQGNGIVAEIDNNENTIIGIDIVNGMSELDFSDIIFSLFAKRSDKLMTEGVAVNLMNEEKVFSDIRTIRIASTIREIKIKNSTFPNVRQVISNNCYYESAPVLMSLHKLLNTFCRKDNEKLDMSKIFTACDGAFDGCDTQNIVNFNDIAHFKKSNFIGCGSYKKNGLEIIGPILISADMTDEKITIPANIKFVTDDAFDFDAHIEVSSPYQVMLFAKTKGVKNLTVNCRKMFFDQFDFLSVFPYLENIYVTESNGMFKSVDGILYTKDGKALIACPVQKSGVVHIPEGTEIIYDNAFKASKITELYFPDSLKTIGKSACAWMRNLELIDFGRGLKSLSESVCNGCSKLKTVKFHSSVTKINSFAFSNCDALKNITLGCNVTEIEHNAFNSVAMDNITLPSSVRCIDISALNKVSEVIFDSANEWPHGLIKAVACYSVVHTDVSVNRVIRIYDKHTGFELYVPEYFESPEKFQFISDLFDLGFMQKLTSRFVAEYMSGNIRLMLLCCLYKRNPEDKKVIKMLQDYMKSWDKIKKYFFESVSPANETAQMREQRFSELANLMITGIVPVNMLKKILVFSQEHKLTAIMAYAMNAINKSTDKNHKLDV